jgi:hypothetical protein
MGVQSGEEEPTGSGVVLRGLAGVALAIVLLYWLVSVRAVPTRVVARRQCESAYASARTAADTTAADAVKPVGGTSDSVPLTCGDLRRRGQLR